MELKNLDWHFIIDEIKNLSSCEESKEELSRLRALKSSDSAQKSVHNIIEAQNILQNSSRPRIESVDLFYTWFRRLRQKAVLKNIELKDVRRFCMDTQDFWSLLKDFDSPWSQKIKSRMLQVEEPLSAINQIITLDGEIRSDASEKLFNLYKEKKQSARTIEKTLDKMVKLHEMEPLLQDKYVTNREGRWVLPIKSGLQHSFEGIIHAQSNSKQTVFMEPQEIIPINNRIQVIESEIQDEIQFLLQELSHYLGAKVDDFEITHQTLLEADITFAKAQFSEMVQAKAFEFTTNEIQLHHLKHPLLILNQEDVIPNNIVLNPQRRILLLSGPNAGGKTVLLKALGIALHMARCGLPICVSEGSCVPFIEKIYIAIGDHQSVDEQLSTFAAHLKVLDSALNAKGLNELILVDEICGSTDPEEGSALARSFIQEYEKQNIFAVITSHLSPLKMGWEKTSGVINGSLEYDKALGKPSYQFLMGVPGESLALQTAQRVGIDKNIIENAIRQLNPDTQKYMDQLKEVEKIKEELFHQKSQLEKELDQARKEKNKYHHLLQKLETEKNIILEQEVAKSKKELENMMNFDKVDDIFKRHEKYEKIKHELPKIIKHSDTSRELDIQTVDDFKNEFPPGTKLFIPSIGKDGIVQSEPNSKGELFLLAQSMRVSVHWESLRPFKKKFIGKSKIITSSHSPSLLHERDRVIDIRGKYIDEAINELDRGLDSAMLAQEDRVKVIHGHGTETLKRAVRRHLSRSKYVRKWQAGDPKSGGDGLTWVELAF